jgi:hypothetical protein
MAGKQSRNGSEREHHLHHFASRQLIDLEAELERASDGRMGRAPTQIMNLADYECRHGRIPGDRTSPCGCFPNERASDEPVLPPEPGEVIELRPRGAARRSRR